MRKLQVILAIMLIVGLTATMAIAKEEILDVKITDMVEKVDRNGNTYVRFIAEFDREIKGQPYTTGIPIMAFGSTVAQAQTLGVGDQLKCVAQYRVYNSRESYTILAWMK